MLSAVGLGPVRLRAVVDLAFKPRALLLEAVSFFAVEVELEWALLFDEVELLLAGAVFFAALEPAVSVCPAWPIARAPGETAAVIKKPSRVAT
jgi:hypothetical protein